jgi:hypothetical protein
MRKVQNGVRLFLQPSSSLRHTGFTATRFASSLREENKQPFVLPRSVIDLDALGSKFVKQWDDMGVSEREAYSYTRIAGTEIETKKMSTQPHFSPPPAKIQATPADVWNYTLLANPRGPGRNPSQYRELEMLFSNYDIWRRDRVLDKQRKLLNGLPDSATYPDFFKPRVDPIRVDLMDIATVTTLIQSCRDWHDFRRLVSVLSTTVEGCTSMALSGKQMSNAVQRFRANAEKPTDDEVLCLLNNLTLNLRSKGLLSHIGSRFCNLCIYYACRCHALQAVEMYLQISQDNLFATNFNTGKGALVLFWDLIKNKRNNRKTCNYERHAKVDEVVKLLTGRASDIDPVLGEENNTSFSSLLVQPYTKDSRGDHGLYDKYILLLGELGWSHSLQREWVRAADVGYTLSRNSRAILFSVALLLAKDRQGAKMALEEVFRTEIIATKSKSNPLPHQPLSLEEHVYLKRLLFMRYDLLDMPRGSPKDERSALGEASPLLDQFMIRFRKGPAEALHAIELVLSSKAKAE